MGSASLPNFTVQRGTPFQGAVDSLGDPVKVYGFGLVNNDTLIDVLGSNTLPTSNGARSIRYFETVGIVGVQRRLAAQGALALKVYPNPTSDVVYWEQPLKGTVQVYNTLGQEVLQMSINGEQSLDVGQLQAGTHLLVVTTDAHIYQQTIVLK